MTKPKRFEGTRRTTLRACRAFRAKAIVLALTALALQLDTLTAQAQVPAAATPDPPDAAPAPLTLGYNCSDGVCVPPDVHVGTGYHPFRHSYLMAGVNWAWSPCQTTLYEIEASIPYVFGNFWWLGGWASLGFRGSGPPTKVPCSALPDGKKLETGERVGGGVELGWRVIGGDVGYVYDKAVRALPDTSAHGVRTRLGLAISDELFTSSCATYRRSCCNGGKPDPDHLEDADEHYSVPCECERNPVGLSVFIYWAHEAYWRDSDFHGFYDNQFGISLKVGVGL